MRVLPGISARTACFARNKHCRRSETSHRRNALLQFLHVLARTSPCLPARGHLQTPDTPWRSGGSDERPCQAQGACLVTDNRVEPSNSKRRRPKMSDFAPRRRVIIGRFRISTQGVKWIRIHETRAGCWGQACCRCGETARARGGEAPPINGNQGRELLICVLSNPPLADIKSRGARARAAPAWCLGRCPCPTRTRQSAQSPCPSRSAARSRIRAAPRTTGTSLD